MTTKDKTTTVVVDPMDATTMNFNSAAEISGITPQYFRRLVRDGKVPSAKKNARGFWRFDEKAVKDWSANRPARSSDGKTTYKVRLSDEEADALKASGIILTPAYKRKPKKEA